MRTRFLRPVAAVLIASLLPIVAQSAAAAATTCATVAACIFGINTASGSAVEGESWSGLGVSGLSGSGYGVEGKSKTNDGVVGHTAVNAAAPQFGKAGVSGYDDSTNHNTYNSGVYGVSISSTGVQGRSTNGPGVFASSSKGNGIVAVSGSALYSGFTNNGIVAQSSTGNGLLGIGTTTGVVGFATQYCDYYGCPSVLQSEIPSGAALVGATDNGGLGLDIQTDVNPQLGVFGYTGVGATITASEVGIAATSTCGYNADYCPAAIIASGSTEVPRDASQIIGMQGAIVSGFNALSVTAIGTGIAVSGGGAQQACGACTGVAIMAQGAASGAVLFEGSTSTGKTTSQLDDAGNLVIAGKLTENGTITSQLRGSDGTYSAAYNARSTMPTVEDMGEANLVSGAGYVALDPVLRKSIDMARGYLVFLTPEGATSGLYVSGRSPAGFAVHEIGGAHDSLAFDYRIVAHPYGEHDGRLAASAVAIRPVVANKALFYRHVKPLRFHHGQLDRTSLPVPSL